jgi:transposase
MVDGYHPLTDSLWQAIALLLSVQRRRRLHPVLTDNGYRGALPGTSRPLGLRHKLVSKPPSAQGFVPVARRWVVERTFAERAGFRPLVIDYGYTPASYVSWRLLANIGLCLNQ